ncbi:MAG: SRPBCC family protein [Nannocystaceae bacterium]|nr:SRPBCC family protein [bacterium]
MSNARITIEALVQAPTGRVWRHWTDPKHITQWNFASDDWCCPSAENDLRPGGRYKARMEAKDGSFGFDFEAVYDEVSEHDTLIYTMPDGRTVTTKFEVESGAVRVTTTFDADAEHPIEVQRQGWQAILNNFKRYAEVSS